MPRLACKLKFRKKWVFQFIFLWFCLQIPILRFPEFSKLFFVAIDEEVEKDNGGESKYFKSGGNKENGSGRRVHRLRVHQLHQAARREVRDPTEDHRDGENLKGLNWNRVYNNDVKYFHQIFWTKPHILRSVKSFGNV